MTAIESILFPVDLSPSCAAMAPFVKRAAALWGARVRLLYVLDLAASGFELLVRPLREVEEHCKALRKRSSIHFSNGQSLQSADIMAEAFRPNPGGEE